jgi:hypothetical protein
MNLVRRFVSRSTPAALALLCLSACTKERPPSADRVSLRVFGVAHDAIEQDPYQGVGFVRVAVTSGPTTLSDKFFTYDKSLARALDFIPFGQNLQVTVEGRAAVAGGAEGTTVGQVLSRGRSTRFDMDVDGDAVNLQIALARLNTFSNTSQAGTTAGAAATSLNRGRFGHTVTPLPNGKVLITGGLAYRDGKTGDFTGPGDIGALFKDAEVYDPASGAFLPVGSLLQARALHSATLLPDGTVLIGGGISASALGDAISANTFEHFDPLTGTFALVTGVTMNEARAAHTATLLDTNGNVLMAGGFGIGDDKSLTIRGTGEVVCLADFPCAKTKVGVVFTDVMVEARAFHTAQAVKLGPNGELDGVVLIGGEGPDGPRGTAETFLLRNPAGFEKKAPADLPKLISGGRTRHTATYVDGQKFIHVVGGFSDKGHVKAVQQIDSFDVRQRTFQSSTSFFSVEARGGHGAVLLDRNTVLVFGGFSNGKPLASAEVIFERRDAADGKTYIDRGAVEPMRKPRGGAVGLYLENGTALVVGGIDETGHFQTSGEFFNPL